MCQKHLQFDAHPRERQTASIALLILRPVLMVEEIYGSGETVGLAVMLTRA